MCQQGTGHERNGLAACGCESGWGNGDSLGLVGPVDGLRVRPGRHAENLKRARGGEWGSGHACQDAGWRALGASRERVFGRKDPQFRIS